MNAIAECTVPEKILLAAHQLEEEGQSPFSAEALIVYSWQKFPRTFGLKGYADLYPDSNKVLSSIMGVKGLANRGWLVKMGQKLYSLTRDGREIVRHILEGGEPPAGKGPIRLTRDQEKFLHNMFDSQAVEKYIEGRKPDLNFGDACHFWDINETMKTDALNARLSRLRSQLADLEQTLAKGDAELSNGRSVSVEEVSQLAEVNQCLEERFTRHLNLLKTRNERD